MKRTKLSGMICALAVLLLLFSVATAMADEAVDLNNRGNAYYLKGNYDRAIVDWEAVLRINPNHATARRSIELAREKRGAEQRAKAVSAPPLQP